MKKRNLRNIYILLTGMCITLIILISSIAANINDSRVKSLSSLTSNDNSANSQTEIISTESDESYIVRFYKGSVAVFDSNGNIYDILEISRNILTDNDIEELNKGIHAADKSELQSIIEDFMS